MRRTNDRISGQFPPERNVQPQLLARAWRQGTCAQKLRRRQLLLVGIAVLMGLLRGAGGDIGAGIASAVVMLAVFSPMLLFWNRQISRINKRGAKLEAGQFQASEAEGEKALSNHWNRHYVGAARIRLSDGTVLRSVEMPYSQAVQMSGRSGTFPVWLVLIEGEDKPVAFLR